MQKTMPVAEITAHLKNGTSDKELMKKYGMSEKGLKRLFNNFLKASSHGSRQIQVESEK